MNKGKGVMIADIAAALKRHHALPDSDGGAGHDLWGSVMAPDEQWLIWGYTRASIWGGTQHDPAQQGKAEQTASKSEEEELTGQSHSSTDWKWHAFTGNAANV